MLSFFFIVYNILFFIIILLLYPYFYIRALITGKDKHGIYQRIGLISKSIFKNNEYIWFHAVSAGEAKVAVPIVEKFIKNQNIAVSVGTETGYNMIKEHFGDDVDLFYMPVDFIFCLYRLFNIINPKALIIVETEIWPQLIRLAHLKKVPVLLINGRMPPKVINNYKRFSFFWKYIFKMYEKILVTNKVEKKKFIKSGAKKESIDIVGNIKFDIYSNRDINNKRIEKLNNLFKNKDDNKTIIIGSTHKNEEEILLKEILKVECKVNIVLAPRHMTRIKEVSKLLESMNLSYEYRSSNKLSWNKDIVIWDTMGELDILYRYGDIVFVGGSWITQGGHNIIEPAFWAKPIIVGPYMQNFEAIFKYFFENEAIIKANKNQIKDRLSKLLNNKKLRKKYSNNAVNCINSNKGSVNKYHEIIKEIITK